jgi:hypothetical protein
VDERVAIERLKENTLDELAEDDIGLWEPLWTLNGWYPDDDEASREAVAQKALQELHEAGHIALYRMPWATQAEGAKVPVPADEAQKELQASWWRELPLPSGDVWVTATQERPTS